MKRVLIMFGTGTLLLALMAGLAVFARGATSAATSTAPEPAGAEIQINNFAFTPDTITVPVGAQVTWTNKDEVVHNVVSSDKSIKSKALDTDDKFTFTFTKPGTFSYVCTIHPRMKGTVVVK